MRCARRGCLEGAVAVAQGGTLAMALCPADAELVAAAAPAMRVRPLRRTTSAVPGRRPRGA